MNEHTEAIPCAGVATQGWHAWADSMPPGPTKLYAVGMARVANPGIIATLMMRLQPPPGDPKTMTLSLMLHELPGEWPQVVTWVQARPFEVEAAGDDYHEVIVYCGDEVIAQVPVVQVQ